MVKQVTAYEAEDGKVFTEEGEAVRHEVYLKLKAFGAFQVPTIDAILDHALTLIEFLEPLRDIANKPLETLADLPQSESHSNG